MAFFYGIRGNKTVKSKTCLQEFIKYSSLNILGMLSLSCYILADTFFVSKGLGTNGLAALNLAIPLYSFINGAGLLLGMGGATKFSILKSQKEKKNANRVFTNTCALALFIAISFSIIGLVFSDVIAKTLGANITIFQMSKTYIQILLLFSPMFIFNNILLCFVRNDGSPHLSMLAMIGGSMSNIILDYLFIFPFDMGIFGAAFATSLAPIISMLLLSPYFFKKRNTFCLVKCKLSKKICTVVFASGLPTFITEVSSGFVMIVFNTIILHIQGNTGVAAYGIIANLSLVVIAMYTGIGQGMQPLLSHNYGLRNVVNVKAILKYAVVLIIGLSSIIYLFIFFQAHEIVAIFNSENNTVLEQIAVTGVQIYFTGCVFAGINIILSVYFTSTENVFPAHVISILRGFVITIPLAFLLSNLAGGIGIWFVFVITEGIVSIIGIILYWRFKRE